MNHNSDEPKYPAAILLSYKKEMHHNTFLKIHHKSGALFF